MALIKRITRLFTADMHAVLDNVEEPYALLKQSVREMEDDVFRHQQHIKGMEYDLKITESKILEVKQNLTAMETELNVCFDCKNEQLARSTIKRQLSTKRLLKILERKKAGFQSQIQELSALLDDKLSKLEAMRQKQEIFAEESRPSDPEYAVFYESSELGEDEVEIAFLKEKQKRNTQ